MKTLTLIMLLLGCWITTAQADPVLQFNAGYIVKPLPGSSTTAAYITIINPDSKARQIVAISSPVFRAVQMHETRIEQDITRMVQHDSLEIPANGQLELKPGGWHLMLIEPTAEFSAQELILLELIEQDGTQHTLELPVRTLQVAPHDHSHQH